MKPFVRALSGQPFSILMVFLLLTGDALPGAAAVAQMNLPGKELVEITGGTGTRAWRIKYGTLDSYQKKFVMAGESRAWFSHSGWLRLIDTEKGVVVGRWHFPGSIVQLTPADGRVEVEVEDKLNDQVFHRIVTFDPGAGAAIPYWPTGDLLLILVPLKEVDLLWSVSGKAGILSEKWAAPGEQEVKKQISELEEAIRRDPVSPLIRVGLWRSLRAAGDARASAVLEDVLLVKTTDFTEMLRISSLLEQWNEPGPAGTAFELGYRDFLEHGNDPRLMMGLIGRLILFHPFLPKLPDSNTDHGRELMERIYRLGPRCEAADLAWQLYADILDKSGRREEARQWRVRGKEAASTAVFLMPRSSTLLTDWVLLLAIASVIAAGLCVVLLWLRYRPQRRADSAEKKGRSLLRRAFSFLSLQYWTRSQRVAFLSMLLVAWVATGFVAGMMRGFLRVATAPISSTMGSLAGPESVWWFENKLPRTPERDLLLAVAYHQTGEMKKAEGLYRRVPGFAESWNNLGVILKSAGKDQEARQAFEKALEIDPALAEAALNLGRPAQGIWAEQYAKYFPGRPMLAPPRPERFTNAMFGGSLGKVLLRGMAGPFEGTDPRKLFNLLAQLGDEHVALVLGVLGTFVAALGLAVALGLFFIPYRPVTQPPSKISRLLEILFPGSSPLWGALGGLALVAWVSLVLQGLLIFKLGTPYILSSLAMVSPSRAYGLPPVDSSVVFQMVSPSWIWVYLVPAGLFAVNLGLVLAFGRSRNAASAVGEN